MKKYIIENSDGTIAICTGVPTLSEGQTLHKEVSSLYPLPERDKFRDAWRLKNGQIKVDLAVARQLKKAELLAERDKRVAANATQFAIDLSLAKDTSAITEQQMILNDLESVIDSALAKKKALSTIDSYDPFAEAGL